MCFKDLKSKCYVIKLKCYVGDPDRYWSIGRKRYCTLYLLIVYVGYITGVRVHSRIREGVTKTETTGQKAINEGQDRTY